MNKKLLVFIIYLVFALAIQFTESQGLKVGLLAAIIYSAVFIKGINQYLVYMSVSIVLYAIESYPMVLLATLPVYASPASFRSVKNHIVPLGIVTILAMFSYFFGIDSQISTMAVFLSSVLVFVQVVDMKIEKEEFFDYVTLAAAILVSILAINVLTGTLELRFGRLSINDNIRQVANLISIPTVTSWSMLFLKGKRKMMYIVVGTISTFVLLLTISKGALIATAVGLLVVYFASAKRFSFSSLLTLIIALAVLYVLYSYAQTMEDYHFDRLFEQDEGFSGRTSIWEIYWDYLTETPQTIIFGLGPGDLKRLMVSEFYAHSIFLDMVFCYGIAMAITWFVILVYIFKLVLKSKDAFAMGFLIFSCLLYATHGNVTFPLFYIQIGVAIAFAKNKINAVHA